MRRAAAVLASLGLVLGVAGCQFPFGPKKECLFKDVHMTFEHGNRTLITYELACSVHPISIKHGSALVGLYLNKGNHKWEGGVGKKFITLNSLPPANGKFYPYKFEGACFPDTRERVHVYIKSDWVTGPDNFDRYFPTPLGKLTRGCGQARGQRG